MAFRYIRQLRNRAAVCSYQHANHESCGTLSAANHALQTISRPNTCLLPAALLPSPSPPFPSYVLLFPFTNSPPSPLHLPSTTAKKHKLMHASSNLINIIFFAGVSYSEILE